MKCKVCGAHNEDYLEYCENCAAPLTPDEAPEQTQSQDQDYQSYVASTGETPPAWGFVKAPQWPKPEFDANTVSEEDIPEGYAKRFNPRPAYGAEPVKPALAPVDDTLYSNNVRLHQQPAAVPETRQPVRPVRQGNQGAPRMKQEPVPGGDGGAYAATPVAVTPAPKKAKPAKVSSGFDDFDDAKPMRRTRGKQAGGKRNMLFLGAAAGLVVLIAVLLIVLVNTRHGGSFSKFLSCTFAGDPITREPVVKEGTTDDGDKAYLITVYAKKNYTIRFVAGDLVTERAISKKSIVLRVPETVWIPDEPLTESEIRVTPDITVISPSGESTQLEFAEEIVISVPTIEMTVNQPSVNDFTVDNPVVPISGTVSDNTVSVFVADNQMAIDEAGNFSTTYTLPAEGTYTITVEARKNGCQSAVATYNVTYGAATDPITSPTQGNVALDINSAIKRSDTTATMAVSGTMEAGATIAVSGVELEGAVTQDSAAGTFSFTVKTADVGVYEAVITATKEGAAKTTTVYLEHQPDKTEYMGSVYRIDYERIRDYPNHEQGYKIVGEVVEVYQSTPFVKARIKTDAGEIVFLYYSGVSEVAIGDGKTYELYADPYGTDDATGLPQMHAWFILKRAN